MHAVIGKSLKYSFIIMAFLSFIMGGQAQAATAAISPSVTTVVSGSGVVVKLDGSASTSSVTPNALSYQWSFLGTSMDTNISPLSVNIVSSESISSSSATVISVTSYASAAAVPSPITLDWGDSILSFTVHAQAITENIVLYVGLTVRDTAMAISSQVVQNITIIPANFLQSNPQQNLDNLPSLSWAMQVQQGDPVILDAISLISNVGQPTTGLTEFSWEYVKTVNYDNFNVPTFVDFMRSNGLDPTKTKNISLPNLSSNIVPIFVLPSGMTNISLKLDDNGLNDDIQIFTKSGKHLAGTKIPSGTWTDNGINKSNVNTIMTTANGFSAGAIYDDTSLYIGHTPFTNPPTITQTITGSSTSTMNIQFSGDGSTGSSLETLNIDKTSEDIVVIVTGGGAFGLNISWDILPVAFSLALINPEPSVDVTLNVGDRTGFGDQYISFVAPSLSSNRAMTLIIGLSARDGITSEIKKQLIVIDVLSKTSSIYGGVNTNAPVAATTPTSYSVASGQAIALDATGSKDSKSGSLLTYQWEYLAAVNFDSTPSNSNTVRLSKPKTDMSGATITSMVPSSPSSPTVASVTSSPSVVPPLGTKTGWGDQYLSFYAPILTDSNQGLIMVFGLTVKDVYGQVSSQISVPVRVVATTTGSSITPPTAVIDILNGTTTFNPMDTVNLDASRSSASAVAVAAPVAAAPAAATPTSLTYSWSVNPPNLVTFSSTTAVKPTLFIPPLATKTSIDIYLTVVDSIGTPSATVTKRLIINQSSIPLPAGCDSVIYPYVVTLMDDGQTPIGLSITGGTLKSINVYHETQTNVNIVNTATNTSGGPISLPFGLVDFQIQMGQPFYMATLNWCFAAPVPAEQTWWKLFNGQWVDMLKYSNGRYFHFNSERTKATMLLVDNGFGDSDPTPGTIRDPAALAPVSSLLVNSGSGDSDPPLVDNSFGDSGPTPEITKFPAASAPVSSGSTPISGKSNGDTKVGCTMNPNARFDPMFPLMLGLSMVYLRRKRHV